MFSDVSSMLLYKAQNKQTNKDFFLLWINYSHILHWVLMLVRYGCIRPKSPPLCWKLWWIADCPPNCDFYRFWRTTVSRNSEIIIYRLSFCTISIRTCQIKLKTFVFLNSGRFCITYESLRPDIFWQITLLTDPSEIRTCQTKFDFQNKIYFKNRSQEWF